MPRVVPRRSATDEPRAEDPGLRVSGPGVAPGREPPEEAAMVVVMKFEASEEQIERVAEMVREAGGEAFVSRGTVHTINGLLGGTGAVPVPAPEPAARRRSLYPGRQAVQDDRAGPTSGADDREGRDDARR